MPEGTPINAAPVLSEDPSEFFYDSGVPHHNRRLTDKILAAFNHAYGMGEIELAHRLWECLAAAEKLGSELQRRRPNQALDLAAVWVAFVDARERYRELSREPSADPKEAANAFRVMRDAYQSWRVHNSSDNPSPLRRTAAAGEAEHRVPAPQTCEHHPAGRHG